MDIAALQLKLRRFAAELLEVAEQTAIDLHAGPGAKTHVLVDWENVQPNEAECRALVPEATDVWLFHGPNQKNVGARYASFGDRAAEVRIAKTGKNALDFHLSFYMGYIASKHPDARFVVLSNDKGYAPMLDHAKELGFVVNQSGFGSARRASSTKKAAARKAPAAAKQATTKRATGKQADAGETAAKKAPAKKAAATSRKAATKKAAAPLRAAGASRTPSTPTLTPAPAPARVKSAASKKSFDQVLALLEKIPPASRPRKHARLLGYLASRIGADADIAEAEAMLARLVADRKVTVDDGWTVGYRL